MRELEERIYAEAHFILDRGATVRETAKMLRQSKSTVHQDVTARLCAINPTLAAEVRVVLNLNKAERHIRGGKATREKYHRLAE